jgi:hypothetical protein
VVKHRPHHPGFAVGWHKSHDQRQNQRCGTGPHPPRPDTPPTTTRQPPDTIPPTQSPPSRCSRPSTTSSRASAHNNLGTGLGAWAPTKRARRPATLAPCGSLSGSCLPKKTANQTVACRMAYLRSAPRTTPKLLDPPSFSRMKIVLGSLGIDPGAGAPPGLAGEDGGMIGRFTLAMRLAQSRRQDQRSPEQVHR